MREKRSIPLEEAIEKFVGKPYSRELAREIEALGFAFTTVNGKIHRVYRPAIICNYHTLIEKLDKTRGS